MALDRRVYYNWRDRGPDASEGSDAMTDQSIEAGRYDAGTGRDEAISPPYVSFNTFRTLLEWLRSEGVPLRFDRSFWQTKFSGSTGSQLVAALRFLGLLRGDRPLPDLENLVEAAFDERRFVLRELLTDSYAAVPFDKLDRATPAMLRRWFSAYPIDGHTLRKAISFFVSAAKEAEIPMSNAVSKMSKSKAPRTAAVREKQVVHRTAATHADERYQASAVDRPADRTAPPLSRTMINLNSGGAVTVDLAVDLFHLSDQDREFVLKLVEHTRSYKQEPGSSST